MDTPEIQFPKKRGRKPSAKRDMFCHHCEKMYSSVSKYNRHYKENHAEDAKKFKCKECSKVFKRRSHLNRHIKALHLNQKLQCPLCVGRYMEKRALTCHLKMKHSSYRCLKCDMVLPISEKEAHICNTKSIKTSWKNKKTCPICLKTYQRYGYLKKHLMNVHYNSYEDAKEKAAAKKIMERHLDPAEQLEQLKLSKDEEDVDLLKEGLADIDEEEMMRDRKEYCQIEDLDSKDEKPSFGLSRGSVIQKIDLFSGNVVLPKQIYAQQKQNSIFGRGSIKIRPGNKKAEEVVVVSVGDDDQSPGENDSF